MLEGDADGAARAAGECVMEPNVDERGVPYCAYEECGEYDGKRCRLLGHRPGNLCEPAVEKMAATLAENSSQVTPRSHAPAPLENV